MAKADNSSSTIDWMWLRDALALAAARFGSVALAKKRLREWMASGRLPWSCMSWKGLDAEGIATLDQFAWLVSVALRLHRLRQETPGADPLEQHPKRALARRVRSANFNRLT